MYWFETWFMDEVHLQGSGGTGLKPETQMMDHLLKTELYLVYCMNDTDVYKSVI